MSRASFGVLTRKAPASKKKYANKKKKDPKVGTGKKPKGSGRRLYTDENPKDTVSIKYATPSDARATVAKVKELINLLLERYRFLQLWSKEQK